MIAPLYKAHNGTIKVAGSTNCLTTARCILHFILMRKAPVELFYIGASAGQQAMKAVSIASSILKKETEGVSSLLVEIGHYSTVLNSAETHKTVDATVLRVYVTRLETINHLKAQNGIEEGKSP